MEIIKTEQFDETVKEGVTLVDFFADWCGPCKMLAPVLEKVAEEYEGKVKFVKVNVDEDIDLARKFDVVSIPTLILFKDGEVVNQTLGYHPAEDLKQLVESGL